MYKAIQANTGEEIIILHPRWRKRIEDLRTMDQEDLLVCQGCRQPMRVKAGEVKRAHFAHKHLKACSFGRESPEILNARAILYEWLHRQFGDDVTLEKSIEGEELPRPVDCWVETGRGRFGYWIIETGIKLDPRMAIKAAFERQDVRLHTVFLVSMLNEEKKEFHSLLLTPTERFFLQATPYDEILAGAGDVGGSLHYLDSEAERLITFRNLSLFHRPNWFKGLKKITGLGEVRANQADGGFIHPGESARLGAFRQKQQRLAEKRKKIHTREAGQEQESTGGPVGLSSLPAKLPPVQQAPEIAGPEELPCVTCGNLTRDYWSTFYDEQGRKMCRCRECLDRGL